MTGDDMQLNGATKMVLLAVAGAGIQTAAEVGVPPTPHYDSINAWGTAALLGSMGGIYAGTSAAIGAVSAGAEGVSEGMRGVKLGGAFIAGVVAARAVGMVIGARTYGSPPG